jgi:DNA-binding NtrC family response regulator
MTVPSASSNRRRRVLAIDDEPAMTEWLRMVIEAGGYDVRTALIASRGAEIFSEWHPDVVVSDLTLPDLDGISLLRRLKGLDPGATVIVISGDGTLERAVEAGQAGAFQFLEKPVRQERLIETISRAIDEAGADRPVVARHSTRESGRSADGEIVGQSKRMRDLFDLIDSVAASDANILIQGENGTGKELIANAVHASSSRVKGPFIKINCAAIPKDLIESELFGYKKGAFTGAATDKVGLLEAAEGGSILLDEIGEMPPYLQTKLLRVLQEREYRPIGSDRLVHVDFRLICATNIDLDVALREGKLREDLYFRINTITLRVPALRERPEDIPLLCDFFLTRFNQRYQKAATGIGADAFTLLTQYKWPGNVRELENALERAVLVTKASEIAPEDLPPSICEPRVDQAEFVVPGRRTLAEIERMVILQTLQRTNWNKREAAQILGLYRPTLYSKMRKHAIADERARARASRDPELAASSPN